MTTKCKRCGKPVAEKDIGSTGLGYVRCRPCTIEMLSGGKPGRILDTATGKLK